jgi:hypothetical protein
MSEKRQQTRQDCGTTATSVVQDFLKQKDLGERKVRIITAELINQMNQPEAQTEEFDVLWDRTLDIMEDNNKQILGICSPAVSAFIRDAVLNMHLLLDVQKRNKYTFCLISYNQM